VIFEVSLEVRGPDDSTVHGPSIFSELGQKALQGGDLKISTVKWFTFHRPKILDRVPKSNFRARSEMT
jgi:hypothetical protein